nr:reverse transcriptase domain-containing protein [Tanacetum cinerariifolium]
MVDDKPIWGNNRAVAQTLAAAIVLFKLGDNFNVKGNHISMIKDYQFVGHARADSHKHITEFIKICVNLNDKSAIIHDDSDDEAGEAKKEEVPSSSKPTQSDQLLLKFNETSLDKEIKEFMAIVVEIPEHKEEVDENFKELPLELELRIKTSIEDPPTDHEMKPLSKHLEYAFLEKDSLFPIVISALLKVNEKKRLVFILKNHKEAFAWKKFDIPHISMSFCKH